MIDIYHTWGVPFCVISFILYECLPASVCCTYTIHSAVLELINIVPILDHMNGPRSQDLLLTAVDRYHWKI
jgi:hypothetical protein